MADREKLSDDQVSVCESSDDEEKPSLISQIDAETEQLAHCDLCRMPLGPAAEDATTHAFRCYNCELSVQCETCCSQAHVWSANHVVQVSKMYNIFRASFDAET